MAKLHVMKNRNLQHYLQLIQQFKWLDSDKFDTYQNIVMAVIIVVIMVVAINVSLRPINLKQYGALVEYSQQGRYPLTRQMAVELLQQPSINHYQYFRVLRAVHTEQYHIHVQEEIRTEKIKSISAVY